MYLRYKILMHNFSAMAPREDKRQTPSTYSPSGNLGAELFLQNIPLHTITPTNL